MALLGSSSFAGASLALPHAQDSLVRAISASTLRTDYARGLELSASLSKQDGAVACVFSAMVRVSRFDDLGDTVALRRAGTELEQCQATGLWEALRLFELGYVHSVLGNSVKAALKTRDAAQHFKQSSEPEAQAFYAIYAYYMDQLTAGLSWMPFVKDNRTGHLATLRQGAYGNSPYWPLFATPLTWMYYDRKEYGKALQLVDQMLSRSPGHPVFRQMRADMLFQLKRYKEAASLYEQSMDQYQRRAPHSLRYWCAVGNLARIYQAMGDKARSKAMADRLRSEPFKAQKRWMPSSLMDDLEERDLYP